MARVLSVLTVYDRPGGRSVLTLGPRTDLSGPRVLLVASLTADWVQVRLPVRPNTATGWVRRDQVILSPDPWSIEVTRAAHLLTVRRAGQVTARYPVAIGTASTPTPAGLFFVTDMIETGDPGGAYGPAALGLSGHSDVLTRFGSGDGVLGVHGTDEQSSIGQSASHGCATPTPSRWSARCRMAPPSSSTERRRHAPGRLPLVGTTLRQQRSVAGGRVAKRDRRTRGPSSGGVSSI